MKNWGIALMLTGLIQLAGCVTSPQFPSLGEQSTPGEERRILVTFVDHSIGRNVPGNTQDRYFARSQYANSSWSSQVGAKLAQRYGLRRVAEWPITVLGVACVVYEVPVGKSIESALKAVGQDRQVESVQTMQTFRVLGKPESKMMPYNDPYYRLQKDMQAMHIEAAHYLATGKGVRIAVIDTGIDNTHPDLLRQVTLSENLASLRFGEATDDVHGTAVAGVIAAQSGNGIGIVGIAPDAELFALRACWPEHPGAGEARCNSFTLALAVNEAIRLKANIINLSLTGPHDPLVGRLIRNALEQGIFIVASDSGKAEPNSGFPANLEGVIAVRSIAKDPVPRDIQDIQLTAPGSGILTTLPHGTYDFMSGSSFATPHITGILALMRELKPQLTRAEAMQSLHLHQSATNTALADVDSLKVINACLVLAELSGTFTCPDARVPP